MSKLYILALLFYNITIIFSYSVNNDANVYEESVDDARFNLLELLNNFAEKTGEHRRETTDPSVETWTGRWMPDRPGDPTPPPKISPAGEVQSVSSNRVSMVPGTMGCDNGKTNLSVDWDYSPVNYTCYGKKIIPDPEILPISYSEQVPRSYAAVHKCMDETIEYDDDIPLFGTHRPMWPVYGEYKFIPKQRWLHSMEHGAIVMLYHPCANPLEIKRLKTLVTGCLRRHIISPYSLLDEDRPLALLTWGHRFSMSYVNPELVKNFIRERALRGPERIPSDGPFQEELIKKSEIVSDFKDSTLCPNM